MSEELENSLQQSIETYINERLRDIDDQLARLQTEFNEAFARLRESTSSGQMEPPVSSAITAHLQAAREQKLSGSSSVPSPAADLSLIKGAIEEILQQHSQADVLTALLRNATHFADRAVLFVAKGNEVRGWRLCTARERSELEGVPDIILPVTGSTVVSQAARSGSAETALGTRSEDSGLIEQLGGEPQQLAAVPLIVRQRMVAVLYVDSTWPHHDAIQLESLEILARVAGASVELAPARAAQTQPSATVAQPAPAPPEPEPAPEPEPEEVQETAGVEAQPAEPEYVAAPEPEAPAEPVVTEPVVTEPVVTEPVVTEAVAEAESPQSPEPTPPPVETPSEAPAPAFSQQYSAPLGSVRRWGVAEPELPIEVGEDERRLHNDARRFARLLVSEIKLYNEQKVNEGRSQGNIYDRLREDIDRSRQMYDKRVAPPVAARHDYFHQELVNTLAEGDPAKLGQSYPGAGMAAN